MDDDGMRIDELEELLDRLAADGRRPKFVYTVPSFQNPAGVTMSAERRRRLVEIARERELLVVEDNPYGLLRYEGEPLPPLYQLDGGDYVIYLGTFSKILSPGIRLGWCVAPPPVMEKIVLGKQATDLCTSTLTQYFVAEYFAEGRWRDYVASLAGLYRERRDAMLEALERHFPPQCEWSRPEGGLFLWATLPDYIDTERPARQGAARERRLRPRRRRVRRRARRRARCGSTSRRRSPDEIREGIRRIGQVVWEQVALYETITGESPIVGDGTTEPETGEGGGASLPLRRREGRGEGAG